MKTTKHSVYGKGNELKIYNTQHSDRKSFNKSKHKIEEIVYGKDVRPRRSEERSGHGQVNSAPSSRERRNFENEEKKIKVKKGFYIYTGGGSSWTDSVLYPYIKRNNPESIPSRKGKIDGRTVFESDEAAKESYNDGSRYFSRNKVSLFRSAAERAIEQLICSEKVNSRDIFSFSETEDVINKLSKSTNAGHPEYKKKNDAFVLSQVKDWLNNILVDIKRATFRNVMCKNPSHYFEQEVKKPVDIGSSLMILPTQIFHRFQPSVDTVNNTYEVKIRQVWCIPFRIVALEAFFFLKLTERQKEVNKLEETIYSSSGLSSYDIGKKIVQRLISHRDKYCFHNTIYSIDYSKFDRTVPSFVFDLFYGILEPKFEFTNTQKQLYDLLRIYCKYTPYILNGELNFKAKGVPSGLFITSFIDTFWNLTLWIVSQIVRQKCSSFLNKLLKLSDEQFKTFFDVIVSRKEFKNLGVSPPKEFINVTGDDVLICTHEDDIKMHRLICFSLDMKVSVMPKGEEISGKCFYLGRYWNEFGIPYQTDSYKSVHCIHRSKFYDKDLVGFKSKEELSLFRMLSICLPFEDAFEYIEKTFGDWPLYQKFKRDKKNFKLLKEWPNEGNYREVRYSEISDILTLV